MAGEWKVEVTGLRQLYDALGEMDKAAQKEITKQITQAGKAVAAEASYKVPSANPLGNWGRWIDSATGRDLGFDPGRVASSFKVRRNNFRRRGVNAGIAWQVYQTDPAGSIFEVIGDYSRVRGPQGVLFVSSFNTRFPQRRPRSLFAAYYSVMRPELVQKIRDSIVDAGRKAGLV
jgi:hypothetical protein